MALSTSRGSPSGLPHSPRRNAATRGRPLGLFLRSLRASSALAVLGHLTLSPPALADDVYGNAGSSADDLFYAGLEHMNAGRFAQGCPTIAESQRLNPRPGTLFTLAMCQSRWGHIATAMALLDDYLALVERLPPAKKQIQIQSDRVKDAKKERDEIAPRIPELTLSLPPSAPAGTVVKRDGQVLGPTSLGVASRVDPGEHVLSTEAPGRPVWEQRITIAEGEKKQVTLEVKAPLPGIPDRVETSQPPPVSSIPTLPLEAPQGRRTAAYVAGGVGLAGLALGAVTGALTFAKKGVVDDHCGSAIQQSNERVCDPTGIEATQSGSTLGLVSTVGFGVGIAGIGAAAILLMTEPKRAESAAGTGARWIRAGVLEAGPAGAIVGARGAW